MRFPARAIESIRQFLAEVDPSVVTTQRAAEIFGAFSELERLAGAGRLLFASRASESNQWAAQGHRTPASWFAEIQKTSMGDAFATLETSKSLQNLDKTSATLRSGGLSQAQAKEIALAASKDPSAESDLLKAARSDTLGGLRIRARKVVAQACSKADEVSRYNAIKAARFVRHWSDHTGAFRLDAKLTPDAGARVLSALQVRSDRIFESNREAGHQESPAAYRADALVDLVTGKTSTSYRRGRRSADIDPPSPSSNGRCNTAPTDTVVVRVDASSLRRGYAKGAETCEIAGVGRVPVETARRILPQAFLKIVIRDAVDVLSVCHVGRTVPAHVLTALEERDPSCAVPGCDVSDGLECHHWREDFATCKTTSLSGLVRLCSRHHDMISYGGFRIDGGPGKWRLIPPRPPDTG